MARHWTAYMMGEATQKQADLLDLLATRLDALATKRPETETKPWRTVGTGRGILEWSGVKGAPTKAEASAAITFAQEKIAGREAKIEEAKAGRDPRAQAIATIRALMAEHGISVSEIEG